MELLCPVESFPGAMPTPEQLEAARPRPWPVKLLRRLRR
jgi:hypothetical protein